MKKILAVLLVSLVGILPLSTQAAEVGSDPYYPYYLGAGAIGGVLLFNFLTGGVEALPTVPLMEGSISGGDLLGGAMAVNRVLTVASAVVGIWLADKYAR